MKKTIAVDIDDVLAAENESVRLFINERFGQKHTPEDYLIDGDFWGYWDKVWGVDEKTADEWFQAYLDSDVKGQHPIVDGALEAIAALEKEYELVIITSRHDRFLDVTHEWLDRHFPKTFRRVEFAKVWQGSTEYTKAMAAKKLKADYIIDDNAEHCNLAQQAGIQALLFGEYGWNRNQELVSGVVRVKDWAAVLGYFGVR